MAATDRRRRPAASDPIQRSLSGCWKEGVASQIMVGILDSYLTPFALLLGATARQIGALTAVPNLVGSFSQFFAVRAVDVAGNRRRLLLAILAAQFVFLVPMGFLPYLDWPRKVLLLTALVTGFRALGNLMGPAWGSLVSEYLPPDRRGDYFGFRSRVVGLSGLIGMAFWGAFLYLYSRHASEASGFLILFVSCTALRVVSLYFMAQLVDLPMHRDEESHFTFWMFVRRFRESNFVKFVFYVAAVTFAIQLAVPYFSVYMLKELHFTYLGYMVVTVASQLAGLVSFSIWGRHADAIGTVRVLKMTGWLLPLSPLFWIAGRTVPALAAMEFISGFIWGGFNLCAINFIYDAASPSKRVRCIGYFNIINGTAAFAGASVGGILAERAPVFLGSSYTAIFALSAVLRLAATAFLAPHFREVRETAAAASNLRLFFSVVGLRPMLGRNADLSTPIQPKSDIHFGDRASADRRRKERTD